MDKVLRRRDLGLDCDAVNRAGTEKKDLRLAAEHANAVHDMQEIPPEVVVKVRAALEEAYDENHRNILLLLVELLARVTMKPGMG